jgi:AcrR family transcriptional regulator
MARKTDPDKKDNIIRAAIQVFAKRGYAATRIIDVARAAGIGKGTIYEYFRSKEDLFFAVFQQVMMESEAPMTTAVASGRSSVSQRLKILGEGLISSWLGKLDLYSLTMEFWSATTVSASRERFKAAFQEAYRTFRQALASLIQEGMDSGEFASASRPLEVASGLIGMWDALLLQAWLDNTFDALGTSRTCLEVMLRGLAGREEKESL